MKKKLNDYINNDYHFDRLIMVGIICLVIVISGVFGWLYEFIFYFFNGGMKCFYYRGGNFLPFINIYAYGAMIIWILTYKRRKKPLQVFLISMLACGLLELVTGFFVPIFNNGVRWWSYNEEILNFGNIGGYVCLRSVLFFGLSGLLLIYVILPLVFLIARKLNRKLFLIISIGLCSIFIMDELYNLIFARILSLPRASTVYKQLGFNFQYFTR